MVQLDPQYGRTAGAGKGPLAAVVLAAGRGSRFGGGKLLARYGNGTVLGGALATALAAPVAGVTLVLGCDFEAVRGWVESWAERDGRLRIVHAADWQDGMAASLRAGIAALPDGIAGAYVFLGDMPRVPHAVLQPLAQALADGAPATAPVWRGRRGHPVLIGAALFPALAKLQGDRGAGALLDGLGSRLAELESPDDGVLFDIDQPADLEG